MTKAVSQLYTIKAPISMVWEALTDPKVIDAWGAGPAKMTAKENETFALWGGEIWGKNREVIKREKLIQEWHDDKDNDGMIVTFTLENRGEKTVLTLVHENIPEKKYSSIKKGWKEYYLGPLQELVERSSTS